ncbi:hypothetical protein J5N97_009801 [Dioscorea zingiberensis]|uniref:Uncharacterized protein n=1 Tax=Dioscorea zingiberensis TaxID=325984 RepID=A0A9D5CXI8_9LILI|nr:hypothetical protein J5N97_009801 [Dioscorea zingiberensis]
MPTDFVGYQRSDLPPVFRSQPRRGSRAFIFFYFHGRYEEEAEEVRRSFRNGLTAVVKTASFSGIKGQRAAVEGCAEGRRGGAGSPGMRGRGWAEGAQGAGSR